MNSNKITIIDIDNTIMDFTTVNGINILKLPQRGRGKKMKSRYL